MVDKLNMSIKRYWNDTDRRSPKCLQRNFVRHKSYMGWPGIEPTFPRKEVVLADLLGENKKKKNKKTVVSLRAKIWTRDIPIMYQAYQTLNHDIRYQ